MDSLKVRLMFRLEKCSFDLAATGSFPCDKGKGDDGLKMVGDEMIKNEGLSADEEVGQPARRSRSGTCNPNVGWRAAIGR